jgi:uncharacterized membrane protein
MGVIIFTGVIAGAMPYFTRKHIQFGVMLHEDSGNYKIVKKWKKQYFSWMMILSILVILLMLAALFIGKNEDELTNYFTTVGMVTILAFVILNIASYFKFHHQTKRLKQQDVKKCYVKTDVRVMVSTTFRNEKIAVSNKMFGVIGVAIIMMTILAPILLNSRIGEYVPVHWNAGNELEFASATVGIFAIAPVIQIAILGLLMFANYALVAMKQVISPKNEARSLEQNRRYRLAMSRTIVLATIGLLIVLALPQVMMIFAIETVFFINVVFLYVAVIMLALLYMIIKYGQGGERYTSTSVVIKKNDELKEILDDDHYWKWGMFYINVNDSAIFVEKRFGVGTTVNFARWQVWTMMIGGIAVCVALPFIIICLLG